MVVRALLKKENEMNSIKKVIKVLFLSTHHSLNLQVQECIISPNWNYIRFRLIGSCGRGGGYYPVHPTCTIANARKVYVGCNASIARPGCYIQGAGTVHFGDYVQLAPNVGILSANHDLYDQRKYNAAPIVIGDYSWIGMNSIVTAGVVLGPRTIVAAGAVVTKSFPDGFCILAGVPAKVVKYLDKECFQPWHLENEYYGYIPKEKFESVRTKYLDI